MKKRVKVKTNSIIFLYLIFVLLITSGCSSDDELLKKQKAAWNDESTYLTNFISDVKNAYEDIGEYETNTSLIAARTLQNTFVLLEERCRATSLHLSIPSEETDEFLKDLFAASLLGQTATLHLFQHYKYNRISATDPYVTNYFQDFYDTIEEAYYKLKEADEHFQTIRKALEDGIPYGK